MRKKRVSQQTIAFCLLSVISQAYSLASAEECRDLWVRAHEVRKVETSLFFRRNCAVHQVLKAGTWSSQSTFPFYLRDVTQRHVDTFYIGPVVVVQQVVLPNSPYGFGVVTLHVSLLWRSVSPALGSLYPSCHWGLSSSPASSTLFFSLQTKRVTETLHPWTFDRYQYIIGPLVMFTHSFDMAVVTVFICWRLIFYGLPG